jgi:signal transduction histidine kinase/CheY-like chemotaxis protein
MLTTVIDLIVHVSFLLCIGMIVVVARKCQHSQVRSAFLIMLSIMALWNLGTLLECDFRLATGVTYMGFIDISYMGICTIPIAALYLGKAILQPDWQPRLIHALFIVIPTVSIIMVFTNPLHNLFFSEFSLNSTEAVYGAYYYFHSLYSYGCIAVGIVFMLIASTRSAGLFSKQSMFVILGIVVTAVPNIAYSFGIVNDLPFSVSAASFTISLFCFARAFLKYRFITTLPITLRQVVDLISDGYLVVDKQMYILSYNRALMNIFQDAPSIQLGENIRVFVEQYLLDISYEQFCELQAQSMKRREIVLAETQIKGDFHVRMEITPVMQSKVQVGSIILFKDITQSKLLIEATRAASQAKGDFLSHMSHEIRTPLNAIIGMINIGIHTEDIDKKNYCFERADSASKHLLNLINDVLDMSKIEAEKFELSYETFAFERLIANVTSVANVRAEEKQLTFTVNLDESVPAYIESDELRLSQVITNLLTNAIKFTPEKGTVILSIKEWERLGEDELILQFEVADSGIGISKEQQDRLFTSFSQADASISSKFGGTGLGLAISKQIVELMDGSIWVESEIGHGSKFIFTIKVKKAEGTPLTSGVRNQLLHHRHDFATHTMLIAEDIEINREILSAILDETNVAIDYAEDGNEAVAIFREDPEKYSLILMDINMPGMNGYDATKAIRALNLANAKTIPIIAMTANVFKEDIEKCIQCGMNGHTGKPVDIEALLEILNEYLG